MTNTQILKALGFLTGKATKPNIKKATIALQKFYGLEPDGVLGGVTQRTLEQHRVCGVPDVQAMNRGRRRVCKWPAGHVVTWGIQTPLPGVSIGDQMQSLNRCMNVWSGVSGFRHTYSAGRTSNIYFVLMRQRPGGVLADMQLPCGANTRSRMRGRFDAAEHWDMANTSEDAARGRISFHTTATHESGHSLGIDHLAPSGGRALMNPSYTPETPTITRLDIDQATSRYPGDPEEPDDDGDAGADFVEVKLRINGVGQVYYGRVS